MTDDVIAHAQAIIAKGSKSFALASKLFPPALRADAAMLYAWCRYCDDVIDGQELGHGQSFDYRIGQAQRLGVLRQDTQAALSGEGDVLIDPVYAGLSRVFKQHEIPHRHAFELLKGFEMDADQRLYETEIDLLDYCYHVAGVVGVMMSHVMGAKAPQTLDRASDLGLAFQLTNIARDVIDDARAGRVYVPQNILIQAGAPLEADKLAMQENWPSAHRAACILLDISEPYYESAHIGINDLAPSCRGAIRAALSVYREIGITLRRKGPAAWKGRVGAGKWRKLWLAAKAMGKGQPDLLNMPRDGFYQRPL